MENGFHKRVIRKNEDAMEPLAERMRPVTLDDYLGQGHLVGEGGVLRQSVNSGRISSFILWGPPGVGKTTLANIIARALQRPFFTLSAISAGVKDVRETIQKAERQKFFDQPGPLLFIDEIHRFSKSQQDSLLGAVEKGVVTLIGATTENPGFEVIPALLSRCQVYKLEPLDKKRLITLADRAIAQDEVLKKQAIIIDEYDALLAFSGGDARKLYNALEVVIQAAGETSPESGIRVTNEMVSSLLQERIRLFDKGGDWHYDIASALIKSIRGGDPHAAVYWLARMLEGGEDALFIARRIVIAAAEDIGLANPNALLMATTTFQAVQSVGLPEARIILSQAVIYLACSPKSNSAYLAIQSAQKLARETGDLPVPLHLRNAPNNLMKQLDYGKGYIYPHDAPGHFATQEYLPAEIASTPIYHPQQNPNEQRSKEYLEKWWKNKYRY